MRTLIDLQLKLFSGSISGIQFDINSRDEIPQLLIGLQQIYNNKELRNKVLFILNEAIPENINKNTGRPGMSMWQILVLGTLRLNCNWDYDKVVEISNEHRKVRQMLGHEEGDFQKRYPLQTIKDNVSLLTPEVLDKINECVVKHGHSLTGKKADELNGSCDSFVVETNVHYPTDINLLFDAVRKIITLIAAICEIFGITEWRQHKFNLKTTKKLFNKARSLKRSNSKNKIKRAERDEVIKNAYQTYIEVVESFLQKAEITIGLLRENVFLSSSISARLMSVEHYICHARRQIDQIRRRIIEGETIPHSEKVFSIFEEHTEWICKGKAGVNQELGLSVCILKDQFGFILHHQVMEKVTDDKVAIPMIEETKKKFESLKSCSFDRGFYTPENKKLLKGMLEFVFLPKKGKLSEKDKIEEYSEEFIQARHKHSAVESSINALENHALDRCFDHGIGGFKRYVSLAVLARNIQIIGRIIQKKELKKQKLIKKRLAA